MAARNVLSIQSHVVYGHVGNAAAAFPLERLGHTVWRLNTVQFSNHKGYGDWQGEGVPAAQLANLVDGLEARGALAACDAVLSGYVGSAAVGGVIADAVRRVKRANPAALYLCDPVMGDELPGLYVDAGTAAFLRDDALGLADIVTPNRFELEQLCGHPAADLAAIVAGARTLVARGPHTVLVTSVPQPVADPAEAGQETIAMVAVTATAAWRLATPYLVMEPMPNGAGDAVAALFLGHLLRGRDTPAALGAAAAAVFAVLRATQDAGTRELQLIAAQDALVAPPETFAVERLAL